MEIDGSQPMWMRSRPARTLLRVTAKTLNKWAQSGNIPSLILPGNGRRTHRLYNVAGVGIARPAAAAGAPVEGGPEDVIYARVSRREHQADPDAQIAAVRAAHPHVGRVLTDVCDGVRFRRHGLATLLDLAFAGRVRTVAGPGSGEPGAYAYVAHPDRLCRFAFELLEDTLRRCGAAVVADSYAAGGADGELAEDLLGVVTDLAARLYGPREKRPRTAAAAANDADAEEPAAQRARTDNENDGPVPETV